jgi:hypothetical protein
LLFGELKAHEVSDFPLVKRCGLRPVKNRYQLLFHPERCKAAPGVRFM